MGLSFVMFSCCINSTVYAAVKQAPGYVLTEVNQKELQARANSGNKWSPMYYLHLSCNGSKSQLRCDCMDEWPRALVHV